MVASRWSIAQLVHNAVRKRLLNDLPLNDEQGNDLVPISKRIKYSDDNYILLWNKYRRMYTLSRRSMIEMKVIDHDIGIGLVAKVKIRPSVSIPGISGFYGSHISSRMAEKSHSCVERQLRKKKDSNESKVRRHQIFNLYGIISFVNHACPIHANCIQLNPSIDTNTDWIRITSTKEIQIGEEILVSYRESDCIYPCRACV